MNAYNNPNPTSTRPGKSLFSDVTHIMLNHIMIIIILLYESVV